VCDHVRAKGAAITAEAAIALADTIGADLRLLDVEIEKLLTYVGKAKRIEAADVEALVPYAQAGNVFKLTDAIAERRSADAFALLHQLTRAGAAGPYLLTMIERQFRILLQVSEMTRAGLQPPEIAPLLRLRDFTVQRAAQQARRWTHSELTAAMDLLLATDAAIKTGQTDEDTALDLMLHDLLQRSRPGHGSDRAQSHISLQASASLASSSSQRDDPSSPTMRKRRAEGGGSEGMPQAA
jgi:DNA polymerase-3 subunit delta